MKTPKLAVVSVKGRKEVGEVTQEGKKSCHIRFNRLPNAPVIKMKKNRVIRLLFGDTWE